METLIVAGWTGEDDWLESSDIEAFAEDPELLELARKAERLR